MRVEIYSKFEDGELIKFYLGNTDDYEKGTIVKTKYDNGIFAYLIELSDMTRIWVQENCIWRIDE